MSGENPTATRLRGYAATRLRGYRAHADGGGVSRDASLRGGCAHAAHSGIEHQSSHLHAAA